MDRSNHSWFQADRARCAAVCLSLRKWCVVSLILAFTQAAQAAGPRFVTGPGIWINAGQSEMWATSQLLYYTDAGSLGSGVSHAQADAMVAAAAAVWNVPTSSLTLAQGGQLAEHVSSANTYFGRDGVVFPADVETTNEAAVPVAVIYDTDGSVTDLLLGAGASNPVACRQNAVTESVDDIEPDGHIHHALLLLNGRCVGSAAEQLTQMQYQLTRAFGRVLGLAWSQVNDNVFTATSAVTADQETYWPLMHPLDVLCGTYTYQCMQNPFTLRADDLSSLSGLYPVSNGNLIAGKRLSGSDAVLSWGTLTFPGGQGMGWVNVTAHRQHAGVTEPWELVSTTTGATYQQALQNPVTYSGTTNSGTPYSGAEGYYQFQAVPIDGLSNLFFTTEAINPLYTGAYALAPYVRPPATPSGSPQTVVDYSALGDNFVNITMTSGDGAMGASQSNAGTENAPAAFDPSGFEAGLLAAWGRSSWRSATVRAGRTWTLEVTATDENGAATGNKAQPVVGIWNSTDETGVLPTVAGQGVPFNSRVFGMTQLHISAATANTTMRMVIGDQFGAGRPDFTYRARMLYADTVSPTTVGQGGGLVTISGTGFQPGNVVKVNGVAAVVQSLSASRITVLVPSRAAAGASFGRAVSVSVGDLVTGGTTSAAGALTYTTGADLLGSISAPGSLRTGDTAATPFAVQVLAADGITALPGATVKLSVTTGTAQLSACGTGSSCWVTSDIHGRVQTGVTGVAGGAVTLTATEVGGGASVIADLMDTDPVRSIALSNPAAFVAAGGTGGSWVVRLNLIQDGAAGVGVPVTWNTGAGVYVSATAGVTDSDGSAAITVSVGTLAAGANGTVTACAWGTLCSTWTVSSVDPSQWQVSLAGGAGQSIAVGGALAPVNVLVTDGAGNPLQGATFAVWQRVLGWEGLCPATGACPAAPVLNSAEATLHADVGGGISILPLHVEGQPQTVQIALSWGATGFLTCTLVTAPAP